MSSRIPETPYPHTDKTAKSPQNTLLSVLSVSALGVLRKKDDRFG